jgi:hypothetical protein
MKNQALVALATIHVNVTQTLLKNVKEGANMIGNIFFSSL